MKHQQLRQAKFACPICSQSLKLESSSFKCSAGHCFDISKEGYVNLLPVQNKGSKDPGDNKQMVTARRAFLSLDHYKPLVTSLNELYEKYGSKRGTLLDAGCGEGYYTASFKNEDNLVYGIDIAKEAIKLASKTHKSCIFSVGSVFSTPFEADYFDWINNIYAPIEEDELHRILKQGGYFVSVLPGKNHLAEIKKFIYKKPQQHNTEKEVVSNLQLVSQHELNYQMKLKTGQDILDLLSMTPFAFKLTKTISDRLLALGETECQADFVIRLYQKP